MAHKLRTVIGLEIHIELATQSKMFCGCSAGHFAKKPNTQVCPICLGLPGALPFANEKAIDSTIVMGLAFKSSIAKKSKFDRKHYFYPDLPKGYQISQYEEPLCVGGKYQLENGKKINITRVHLEEDTGKLVHANVKGKKVSLVDYNRSGVPLMEIVTEPDFTNTSEVVTFLKEIQLLVRYLGISQADMEKGSMRLEANISVAKDDKLPDFKVELKNINSFKFLQKAIVSEVGRQEKLVTRGKKINQETRGFDEIKNETFSQRIKEEAQDYRYFPEPDIPPLRISQDRVKKLKLSMSRTPQSYTHALEKLGVSKNYVEVLLQSKKRVKYFIAAHKLAKKHKIKAKTLTDAMINLKMDEEFSRPQEFIKKLVEITKKKNASETEVKKTIKGVLKEEVKAVKEYKAGKKQVIGYLIGAVQKELRGNGKPDMVKRKLEEKLK